VENVHDNNENDLDHAAAMAGVIDAAVDLGICAAR
jgi:hypothetical protein